MCALSWCATAAAFNSKAEVRTGNRSQYLLPAPAKFWLAKHANVSFYVPHVHEGNTVDTSWNGLPWVYGEPGERFVLSVFEEVLQNGSACKNSRLDPPLVLDIGANEGFFGLLASAWGCRSTMFEPQPGCVDLIGESIRANCFDPLRTKLVPNPVSDVPFKLAVSASTVCSGGFPFHRYVRRSTKSDGNPPADLNKYFRPERIRKVPSVAISEIYGKKLDSKIKLVKIDVEGHELAILSDVLALVSRGRVDNIVVEVTPGWWGKEYDELRADRIWHEFELHGFRGLMQTDMDSKGHPYNDLRSMIKSIRRHRRAQGNIWLQRQEKRGSHLL